MKQSILPHKFIQETIKDLTVGKCVYVVPWAMCVDSDGKLWIRDDYIFHEKEGGTCHMMISRHTDGYFVVYQRTIGNYKYVRESLPRVGCGFIPAVLEN